MEWYILYTSEYFENSENSGIEEIGINGKIWEARVRIARDKRTYVRIDKQKINGNESHLYYSSFSKY